MTAYAKSFLASYQRATLLLCASLLVLFDPTGNAAQSAQTSGSLFSYLNSETALPFQVIGKQPTLGEPNGAFRCVTKSQLSREIYHLLLIHLTAHDTPEESRIDTLVMAPKVCSAHYLALGRDRYLTDLYGLGILDIKNRTYSPLWIPNASDQHISKAYLPSKCLAIRIYSEQDTSGQSDYENYWALLFSPLGNSAVRIRVSELASASLENRKHIRRCQIPIKADSSIPSSAILAKPPVVNLKISSATLLITFLKSSADCKRQAPRTNNYVVKFSRGKFSNPSGIEIPIYSLCRARERIE